MSADWRSWAWEIKSVETMIKNEKHYEYAQECAPRVEYLILKLKIIR